MVDRVSIFFYVDQVLILFLAFIADIECDGIAYTIHNNIILELVPVFDIPMSYVFWLHIWIGITWFQSLFDLTPKLFCDTVVSETVAPWALEPITEMISPSGVAVSFITLDKEQMFVYNRIVPFVKSSREWRTRLLFHVGKQVRV